MVELRTEEASLIDDTLRQIINKMLRTNNKRSAEDILSSPNTKSHIQNLLQDMNELRREKESDSSDDDEYSVSSDDEEELEVDVIGKKIELINEKKCLDMRRWDCVSRAQYKRSCGISSLTSVFNFLFSERGYGRLPIQTQEDMIGLLGKKPPFDEIMFGSFTGNRTLIRWFKKFCKHFGVRGKARVIWKEVGTGKKGNAKDCQKKMLDGLKSTNKAYIYHSFNHYMCPIGYEVTNQDPTRAYEQKIATAEQTARANDIYIIMGDTSKSYGPLQSVKWTDIVLDLSQRSPYTYNVRKPWLGVTKKEPEKVKRKGNNLHCIIEFEAIRKL
mmetsp:Transcript_6955/g.10177  ORF Transcript_6955/g.10177 Transcript_6955/m.10177 type:complete len:329 (-) Transcript_6955:9-995(-)